MNRMQHSATSFFVLTACAVLSASTGCATQRPAAVPVANDAAVAFQSQNYERAIRLTTPATTESDRLIRGMAELEIGEAARGESTLRPLLRSRDTAVRGRAEAALGLHARASGDHTKAAELLTRAAEHLAGTDRVWAAQYATESHRAIGQHAQADRLVSIAAPLGRTASHPSASVRPGGFAIQFGSFSTESRATRHLQAVTLLTRSEGLPQPRIERVQRGGRTLYAVRTGQFPTTEDASIAARSLPTETTVVRLPTDRGT
ncbi:MAG: SPOR domain-containing protein [Planctomycetota bacterium]